MTLLDRADLALSRLRAEQTREQARRAHERDAGLRRRLIEFADLLTEDPDAPIGVDPLPDEEADRLGVTPRFVTEVDETRVGIALDRRILVEIAYDGETRWGALDLSVGRDDPNAILLAIARTRDRIVDVIAKQQQRVEQAARRDEEAVARWRPRNPADLVEDAEAALANPSVVDQTHALACAVLALVGQADRIALAAEIRDAT